MNNTAFVATEGLKKLGFTNDQAVSILTFACDWEVTQVVNTNMGNNICWCVAVMGAPVPRLCYGSMDILSNEWIWHLRRCATGAVPCCPACVPCNSWHLYRNCFDTHTRHRKFPNHSCTFESVAVRVGSAHRGVYALSTNCVHVPCSCLQLQVPPACNQGLGQGALRVEDFPWLLPPYQD